MQKPVKILAVFIGALLLAGKAWAAPEVLGDQQKRSYAIGANVGNNLKQQRMELDPELIARGLVDAMNGNSRLTDEEVATFVQQFRDELQKKQAAERQQAAEENQRRGAAFQAEYAKRDGVKILPGGVLYRVLQAGAGEKPSGAEFVFCHFRGTLVDGTEFDASKPGKASTFTLDKLIAGWRTALAEMPVGSKWELVIPAEKAYGARGKAPAIGPNATLVFEVELVGFE